MKPLPVYRIAHRHIRLSEGSDGTTWPWPFGGPHESPAWKARYAPNTLTAADAMELAGMADAYAVLITHSVRGVRETLHVLHRIHDREQGGE